MPHGDLTKVICATAQQGALLLKSGLVRIKVNPRYKIFLRYRFVQTIED